VDEKPKEIDQIAQLLGLTKKAVYNRLGRVLKKCRDLIIDSGIKYHDLF
jgi:DNA-directed RNA polymerase specialized sigma24 family protein